MNSAIAFAALVACLALLPGADALASEHASESDCLLREERCPVGYGTVYRVAHCVNGGVAIPLCFI